MKHLHLLLITIISILFLFGCGSSENGLPDTLPDIPALEISEMEENRDVYTLSPIEAEEAVLEPLPINKYTISLSIDPDTRIIEGIQQVRFANKSDVPFDRVYFNVPVGALSRDAKNRPFFENFERRVFQHGRNYSYVRFDSITLDGIEADFVFEATVLAIFPESPIFIGQISEIVLHFEMYIPKINNNFGANDYAMWFGGVIPTLAVFNHNGFNISLSHPAGDPYFSEIANYTVTIATPIEYTVVGTGAIKVVKHEDMRVTTFSAELVRDFAFALSSRFREMSYVGISGIEVTMYYYTDISNVQAFLELADRSLYYFSNLIGPYPFPKLDIIEVGLWAPIGMEYSQIIFMDSVYLSNERALVSLVHEIAHQWFYIIIGNDQFNEPWIDEGLASLLQEFLFRDEDEIYDLFKAQHSRLNAFLAATEHTSLMNNISVYNSWTEYFNIHYTKAKLMFYDLRLKMGISGFEEFLRALYSDFAFKIVYKQDIIDTASRVYENDLTDFFEKWFAEGQMPPFPDRPNW